MTSRRFTCAAAALLALLSLFVVNRSADAQVRDLLLETKSEYGWSHSGTKSWGDKWHRRAVTEANEEIRDKIADMVNLEELEEFTSKNLRKKLDLEGSKNQESASIKVSYDDGNEKSEKLRKKYRNNLLVLVDSVRMKPGTDWSKTEKDWQGRRTWEASATMSYRIRIYGPGTELQEDAD